MQVTPNDLLGFPGTPRSAGARAGLDHADGHGDGLIDGVVSLKGAAVALAEAIASCRLDGSVSTLNRIARIGQLVTDIVGDPFLFVGRKLGKLLPDDLDDSSVSRLGFLAESVMDAAKRDALAHGSRPARRI